MFTPERIDEIRRSAMELFTQTQLMTMPVERGYSLRMPNPMVAEFVLTTLSDGGPIFLATWENLTGVWENVRELDDVGLAEWLLQTSTTFIAKSFGSRQEYGEWLNHLAGAYGSHNASLQLNTNTGVLDIKTLDKALAVDDEYAERLPSKEEHLALLAANPWFAYLLTLQLSYHELFAIIYESELRGEMAERIRTGGRAAAAPE